jgi:hypothetical protein
VADVVTGKLDVRAAARHLPADFVEPVPAPESEGVDGETELELEESGTEH